MDSQSTSRQKTIDEAVADGSLIDITEKAKTYHIKYRTFLVASFWNGSLKQSDEQLGQWLELISGLYAFVGSYDELGYRSVGSFCVLFEPSPEFGLVMVIGGPEGENEMSFKRMTGDKIEYSM